MNDEVDVYYSSGGESGRVTLFCNSTIDDFKKSLFGQDELPSTLARIQVFQNNVRLSVSYDLIPPTAPDNLLEVVDTRGECCLLNTSLPVELSFLLKITNYFEIL